MTFFAFVALFGIVTVVLIGLYNRLVSKRQMVSNGWADIDVQLKRRADLVPQLVTIVKAYAAHEKLLFEEVANRRIAALTAGDQQDQRAVAETQLSRPLAKLIALAEDYPDLKASEQFLSLQQALSDTEDKISMARRFFNGAVREFNIAVESVPARFFAGTFGFSTAHYFEIDTTDRISPKMDFDE